MPSSKRMPSRNADAGLYGVAGAALYLGLSEVHLQRLVRAGHLRYWQERPPRETDGTKTRGSGLVFKREWLDDYQARPRRKPGRPAKGPKQPD